MKKIILVMLLTATLFADLYNVNKQKSTIEFEATKFMFVSVKGVFSDFKGEIIVKDKKLISISGFINVNSIFTQDKQRDNNLKSDGYFNETSFPQIKFHSILIENNNLRAKIFIKNIEKEINFNITNLSIGDENVVLSLTSTLNRQIFKLNGPKSGIISDEIKVTATILANTSK